MDALMTELITELTLELIPDGPEGRYKKMAAAIGTENFYKLCLAFGGETIYIPLSNSIVRPVRNMKISAEYNGYNHVELAAKYGVTERRIRSLCGDKTMTGQISLFETDDSNTDSES